MNSFNPQDPLSLEPEIADYLDFLNSVVQTTPNVVKKDRITANLDKFGNAINTLIVYPDILADIMTPKNFFILYVFCAENGS